jgi:hypothetical protein
MFFQRGPEARTRPDEVRDEIRNRQRVLAAPCIQHRLADPHTVYFPLAFGGFDGFREQEFRAVIMARGPGIVTEMGDCGERVRVGVMKRRRLADTSCYCFSSSSLISFHNPIIVRTCCQLVVFFSPKSRSDGSSPLTFCYGGHSQLSWLRVAIATCLD